MVLVINISHQDQRDDRCVKYQSINYKINKHLFDKSIGYLNVRFPTKFPLTHFFSSFYVNEINLKEICRTVLNISLFFSID